VIYFVTIIKYKLIFNVIFGTLGLSWRWSQKVPPKRLYIYIYTRLHGFTSRKRVIFIVRKNLHVLLHASVARCKLTGEKHALDKVMV